MAASWFGEFVVLRRGCGWWVPDVLGLDCVCMVLAAGR